MNRPFFLVSLVTYLFGYSFTISTITCMDQTPEVFMPGLISTGNYEFGGSFNQDETLFVFTRRSSSNASDNRIYFSMKTDHSWSIPIPAPFANDCFEFEPACSPNGNTVFFGSERKHPVTGVAMVNNEKIWVSKQSGENWSEATFLPGRLNEVFVMNVSATGNNDLYFCGEYGNHSGIFKAYLIDNRYDSIVWQFDGIHPWIAADESFILYDKIIGQNWEETELYVRYRDTGGAWMEEIRLPPEINKTKTESHAFMSPDNKYLFFQRNGDIYRVSETILPPQRR